MTPDEVTGWCASLGMPKFRAKQILEWVYRRGVADPGLMSNLSKLDRRTLAERMTFISGETLTEQLATDGTRKLLVEWRDGDEQPTSSLPILNPGGGDPTRQTECVMIPATDGTRRTACISSQVGCPVGCRFCASGMGGLDGNLSAGRIVEQVWLLDRLVRQAGSGSLRGMENTDGGVLEPGKGITNVVFMGMGEPLSNFRAVVQAVRTLAAPWGMGISARKITISTVGMHRAIERLADELDLPVTLALSLHAPNDGLRRELIPWAEFTTIDQLFTACRKWFDKTGREITLEYTLLRGVNDRETHAAELAGVAKRLRANVNLSRYNEVGGVPYKRPETEDVRRFQEILRAKGLNVHIRASRGRDIAAACGQLRHESAGEERVGSA